MRRIVVKLSGQSISGDQEFGFSEVSLEHLAREIISVAEMGIEVAVVVGGGNVFRGNRSDAWGIDRVEADNIGMLGTVINGVLLRGKLSALWKGNVRLMTALPINNLAEPYIRLRARHHLQKGALVVLGGGNGQPFTTTDYPSVQRAVELGADAVFVAKNGVNGIYTADPNIDSKAEKFDHLSYDEVLRRGLQVMDQSAFILARDHSLPLHIFDIDSTGAMKAIIEGDHIGTVVS